MATSLEQKRINRFRLLRQLYYATAGVTETRPVSMEEVGLEIGMNDETALNTFDYLVGEGLAQRSKIFTYGTITHRGVKEVEDAIDSKPTTHFPANIVIISDSPGARVETSVRQENNQMSTIFDQRGQHVNYQYNAAGNINFGAVQNNYELAAELEKLEAELVTAREAQVLDKLTAAKATTPLLEAAEEAKKLEPDKNLLRSYVDSAKDVLKDVAAVGGLVEALTKASEWIGKML